MSNKGSCFLFYSLAANLVLLSFCLSSLLSPSFTPNLFSLSFSYIPLSLIPSSPFHFAPAEKPYCIYQLGFLIPVQTTIANDFLIGCTLGGFKERREERLKSIMEKKDRQKKEISTCISVCMWTSNVVCSLFTNFLHQLKCRWKKRELVFLQQVEQKDRESGR